MQTDLNQKQQYWLRHVKAAQSSGLTFKAYAQQNQVDLKSLYNWKSQFSLNGVLNVADKNPFVEVKTASKIHKTKPSKKRTLNTLQAERDIPAEVTLPNGIKLSIDHLSSGTLKLLLSL